MSNWKKGALHFHTVWSDGRALPEVALHIWRDELKFDFVCITEHNIFPGDAIYFPLSVPRETPVWPPEFSTDDLATCEKLLGEKIPTEVIGVRRFVRLKSFEELRQQWDIPGKFILLPGCEDTAGHYGGEGQPGHEFHLNLINLSQTVSSEEYAATPSETLRRNVKNCLNAIEKSPEPTVLMLNHPFWRYWDIDPRWVLENPEIELLEICNNCKGDEVHTSDEVNSPEKFWDFVLAHRIIRGEKPIYATATDDSHYYTPDKIHGDTGCGHGWVMVNISGEMTADKIVSALKSGDFYATCGAEFESIDFDRSSRTLKVAAKTAPGEEYIIRFFVTKRGFTQEVRELEYCDENPRFNRVIPIVDDSIGQCVKEVYGISAEYTMADDDLYVRAEVIINGKAGELCGVFYPEYLKAWTQPFL